MHKDARKIKSRIRGAFKKLEGEHIIARANFSCCGSCASFELGTLIDECKYDGYAYYHAQDNDSLNECGNVFIGYSDLATGKKVFEQLKKSHLKVSWNGKEDTRIFVEGII